ncbi:restriction endonuclease subunit S [Synechococcus elongatus]|uniref:restriction endonuclease subunit S n=1 Tax=Synechococcus elongatus TaxID=32046 RepID=UPI0030D32574
MSSLQWAPQIPEHWEITKVRFSVRFTTGWTPPTGKDELYDGSNFWANISDLGPKTLCHTAKTISDKAIELSKIPISEVGSFLFSFKLSIGQVSMVGTPMYMNEAIATFKDSDKALARYCYYLFPLAITQNATENIYGAKLLNQELINAAPLVLPPKYEQELIADFLDRETEKIDALIAEQQRLIELLQEKRQAVISHAVTKGLNPDAPMKDSGVEWLGQVPAHWEIKRLKQVASIQTGLAKGKDLTSEKEEVVEVPYLRVANVQDGYLLLDEVRTIAIPKSQIKRYLLQSGDVLMNEGGDFDKLGRGCIWQEEVEGCIHQNHVLQYDLMIQALIGLIYILLQGLLTRTSSVVQSRVQT